MLRTFCVLCPPVTVLLLSLGVPGRAQKAMPPGAGTRWECAGRAAHALPAVPPCAGFACACRRYGCCLTATTSS